MDKKSLEYILNRATGDVNKALAVIKYVNHSFRRSKYHRIKRERLERVEKLLIKVVNAIEEEKQLIS